jgi:hypothetical protein
VAAAQEVLELLRVLLENILVVEGQEFVPLFQEHKFFMLEVALVALKQRVVLVIPLDLAALVAAVMEL